MFIERNLILAHFENHVHALQPLVIANVERKVTLEDAMTAIRELSEGGRNIQKSDYSVKNEKLTLEIQRSTGLVEAKDL